MRPSPRSVRIRRRNPCPAQLIGPVHANPYPNTDSPGQTPECAAGNERYSGKAARIGNPPGNVGLQDRDDNEAQDVRRHQPRVSSFAAGIIGIVVVAAACYLIFGGALPFSGLAVRAQGGLHERDAAAHPLPGADRRRRRWRGRVGRPTSREARPAWSRWTSTRTGCRSMPTRQRPSGPGSSSRATSTSTWRPGTPNAPMLSSGSTLPAANTSGPVQLDRVLAALTLDARTNLQTLLQGIGASAQHDRHPRRERHAGCDHPQSDRRAGAQQVAGVLDRGVPGIGDRQRGPARRPSRTI